MPVKAFPRKPLPTLANSRGHADAAPMARTGEPLRSLGAPEGLKGADCSDPPPPDPTKGRLWA